MRAISNRFAVVSNTVAMDRHFKPDLKVNLFLSVTEMPV